MTFAVAFTASLLDDVALAKQKVLAAVDAVVGMIVAAATAIDPISNQ